LPTVILLGVTWDPSSPALSSLRSSFCASLLLSAVMVFL
jgi:hypothetical protein